MGSSGEAETILRFQGWELGTLEGGKGLRGDSGPHCQEGSGLHYSAGPKRRGQVLYCHSSEPSSAVQGMKVKFTPLSCVRQQPVGCGTDPYIVENPYINFGSLFNY